MTDVDIQIRCQRCGDQMELRDPPPGHPWKPEQFWVCLRCGRHFWTTYPKPTKAPPKPAAPPAKAAPAAESGSPAAAPKPASPSSAG